MGNACAKAKSQSDGRFWNKKSCYFELKPSRHNTNFCQIYKIFIFIALCSHFFSFRPNFRLCFWMYAESATRGLPHRSALWKFEGNYMTAIYVLINCFRWYDANEFRVSPDILWLEHWFFLISSSKKNERARFKLKLDLQCENWFNIRFISFLFKIKADERKRITQLDSGRRIW